MSAQEDRKCQILSSATTNWQSFTWSVDVLLLTGCLHHVVPPESNLNSFNGLYTELDHYVIFIVQAWTKFCACTDVKPKEVRCILHTPIGCSQLPVFVPANAEHRFGIYRTPAGATNADDLSSSAHVEHCIWRCE